ncbi:MAG TPA: hypothetical protein VMF87_26045 [Streptosporangiaceae bacterium]|nr:hypothetical protein [Streptosporangiaceae bacterium]
MPQADQVSMAIKAGTLMQKAIPPRLVEPYMTGRRAVIAGFVYRVQDTSFAGPAEYYEALDLGYAGSDFGPDVAEVYVLRWNAVGPDAYRIPYSAEHGGDWTGKAPFTGTGYTSSRAHVVAEFYLDPVPVPVGAEIYRITAGGDEFIARYDGQVWLRPVGAI